MRKPVSIGVCLLIALTATAQDPPIENYERDDLLSPNWAFPHMFNLRMTEGGYNSGAEAQLFSCTKEELFERKGRCAALPPDRRVPYGTPVRIDDEKPPKMAEYLGGREGWRIRDYALAKTTQGIARARYVKRTPGQGALVSLQGVNSAQGDFMGLAIDLRDPAGGQAGGDEGLMPLTLYMRDRDHVATGTTIQDLRPGADGFMAYLTSAPTHHDDQAAPRRLLIWTDGPRIPFEVSREGHNPKPHPPAGGATWRLVEPLAFPKDGLPATRLDVFAHERTDWCATLDASAYEHEGTQYNYLLVSRFNGTRQFTTHRLLQGQNVGVYENEYVRGFDAVDHAVEAGHGGGHLIPCSIITGYDDARREFSIAPLIDTRVKSGTAYAIPSMGTMGPEGIKVTYDFKLGTGAGRTGILVNTIPGPDQRKGNRAFVAAGKWAEGFAAFDAEVMLHDYHPREPADRYVFAQLRGSSSWNGHELQIWYPEPNGQGQARVEIPHVPGDSAFVLVRRGEGPPTGGCEEPGLQRYYDLSDDRDYVCASNKQWKRH